VDARRACDLGDDWACLESQEEVYRRYGGNPLNLAAFEHFAGRDSIAMALTERWQRSAPFGLRPIERNNLPQFLLPLGRIDEARRIAESLAGEDGTYQRLAVAAWTADWPAVDTLAARVMERARTPLRTPTIRAQASAAAARGRVREAVGILGNCNCSWEQLVLRMVWGPRGTGAELGTLPRDTTAWGQVFASMWAAAAGDTNEATSSLSLFRSLPAEQRRRMDRTAAFAEGLIEAAEGRPAEAVRLIRPLADVRATLVAMLVQPAQWALAAAYERLGQLDSAVAQLERLATWQGPRGDWGNLRGLTDSFARQRLVLLYARMGRPADARRHWRVFSETFTTPDPELVHLVDEVRAALASAERRP
jgi:tetratricopeptide (TPR) repeat protein